MHKMAISEKTENKTKVLVNVYEPVIAIMKHKLDEACLKRDAYLDKALRLEAGFLRAEVTTPNSDKAKSYIADNLKQLKLKPLNLLLSTETVKLMNDVCKEKNIPRDAFINRVFLLLIASDTVIDALFYRVIHKEYYLEGRTESDSQSMWERCFDEVKCNAFNDYGVRIDNLNILDNIEELVKFQPLGTLRAVFTGAPEWVNLYSYTFEKDALLKLPKEYAFLKTDNTLGFNTFMTDDEVSEQEALDKTISAKINLDKLLAFAKKEKQARPIKNKSVGEGQ
jgi:hypothetical protein